MKRPEGMEPGSNVLQLKSLIFIGTQTAQLSSIPTEGLVSPPSPRHHSREATLA